MFLVGLTKKALRKLRRSLRNHLVIFIELTHFLRYFDHAEFHVDVGVEQTLRGGYLKRMNHTAFTDPHTN